MLDQSNREGSWKSNLEEIRGISLPEVVVFSVLVMDLASMVQTRDHIEFKAVAAVFLGLCMTAAMSRRAFMNDMQDRANLPEDDPGPVEM